MAALLGLLLDDYVPDAWAFKMGASAVDSLLSIIATSMLAVTTFSLSTVVAAYGSATSTATPRATNLLLDDTVTQNMLATFIGAFIYSIVGIVLLKAEVYGTSGRLVLFLVTIFVIGLVVIMLVRWIDFLMHFGRLGNVLDRIENRAMKAMQVLVETPHLGARPYEGTLKRKPPGTHVVVSRTTGYIQFIDVESLNEIAGDEGEVTLAVLPGSYIHRGAPLAYVKHAASSELDDQVCDAFVIGARRTFDQDPRLALITMSEVASRALSPAVNDPGTAIEVIARQVRIIASLEPANDVQEARYPRVRVPCLRLDDLFDDAFLAIGRDGAGQIEVVTRMLKGLAALAEINPDRFGGSARRHMKILQERASAALGAKSDKDMLSAVWKELA